MSNRRVKAARKVINEAPSIHNHHTSCLSLYIMAMELSVPEGEGIKRPAAPYSSLSKLSGPFLIDPSTRSYKHQYSNMYFVRLVQLRPIVEERGGERWEGVRGACFLSPDDLSVLIIDTRLLGKPPLLPRILNLQRSQLCYIVGTIYLDMPLKPNVLEDMARDVSYRPPPVRVIF